MIQLREKVVTILIALLAVWPSFIKAEASTFYIEKTETQFSVTLDANSSDVYIYFTSPAHSWVGFGFGEAMKDSFIIVLYPSEDGKNVTISPRISDGHSEPSFYDGSGLQTLPGTEIKDDMFVLKAICRSCRVWRRGFIDEKNTAQPMIYAFGPGRGLQSNSPSAPLRRHFKYGTFNMNMVTATGKGGVPAPSKADNGVERKTDMKRDHDRASLAHAILGCLAIFVFWPLNVILAGFFTRIKIHIGLSIFIVVFLVTSYGLGISTSYEYNSSKHFQSPHQIFAFVSLAPILVLSILPYPPLARLSPWIPRLHNPFASLSFVFLVLTGGLGLHLAYQSRPIISAYIAVSLLAFCFTILLQTCIRRRGSAYARAKTRRQLGEEDEQDLVLAAYYANSKIEDESRSASAASSNRPGVHGRSGSGGSATNIYGGGTMPGPQYLLNMHPGVPVYLK
ncbi:CBD9-like protein [Lojkania enalia]|uniref:CBD9-like protein n=1 Tax=Lojkania enalia TaxID=147567 RepID=A0A9P4KDP8_9PLEO|nr:CBD9-like protein [Didymosphaeria enalia]